MAAGKNHLRARVHDFYVVRMVGIQFDAPHFQIAISIK